MVLTASCPHSVVVKYYGELQTQNESQNESPRYSPGGGGWGGGHGSQMTSAYLRNKLCTPAICNRSPALWAVVTNDMCIILFDLILYTPSTIFQLYRNGSSWVEPVLS